MQMMKNINHEIIHDKKYYWCKSKCGCL